MTKTEFLQGLKSALENELDARTVQENVHYYERYIEDEVKKGKPEKEVLETLGDPWVIARNIMDSPGGATGKDAYDTVSGETGNTANSTQGGNAGSGRPQWMRVLIVVLVVLAFIAVLKGVLKIIAPILIPICLILFWIKILKKK